MEQKRTKGLAHVREAQPKNRRFAGLGYKSLFNLGPTVWQLMAPSLPVAQQAVATY